MKVEVHGKIFIASEYGVVHGAHAILAPSLKTMRFVIEPSETYKVYSKKYNQMFYPFSKSRQPRPISKAFSIVKRYLNERGITFSPCKVTINSDLDKGRLKLGLGSSATTSVGLIDLLLRWHDVTLDQEALYKLVVLSDIHDVEKTSYGDIALCVFNRWLFYRKFDASWLKTNLEKSLETLIHMPWKDLKVEPLDDLKTPLLLINTKKSANSKKLVEAYNTKIPAPEKQSIAKQMDTLCLAMVEDIKTSQQIKLSHIQAYDTLFKSIAKTYHLKLFTKAMRHIETIVHSHYGVTKFSGAGGGDNVLAFFNDKVSMGKAKKTLEANGYMIVDVLGGQNDE